MKWALVSSLLLYSACSSPARTPASEVTPSVSLPAGYHLVWHDEFPGTSLDPTKWKALIRRRGDAYDGLSAIHVSDGLKITTYSDQGMNYTAFLSTQGLYQTRYGLFEAKINFHDSPGEWCAFWIQSPTNGNPLNDPGRAGMEIDIAEHRVVDEHGVPIQNASGTGALHWNGYGPLHQDIDSVVIAPPNGKSAQGNDHTYAVLWTAGGYEFYIDGTHVLSHLAPETPVSHASEFLYLSCEVRHKGWAGVSPAHGYGGLANSSTGMDVAWVRVWQQ